MSNVTGEILHTVGIIVLILTKVRLEVQHVVVHTSRQGVVDVVSVIAILRPERRLDISSSAYYDLDRTWLCVLVKTSLSNSNSEVVPSM